MQKDLSGFLKKHNYTLLPLAWILQFFVLRREIVRSVGHEDLSTLIIPLIPPYPAYQSNVDAKMI